MGFSSYILETLMRYGRAELGTLGTFILDYSPAEWKVTHQNFEPPKARLEWLTPSSSSSYSLIANVVASLHDISYSKAYDFVDTTIHKLTEGGASIHLGILGSLEKDGSGQDFRFSPHPDLDKVLKFDPLVLKPQFEDNGSKNRFNWWLLILSAAFLTAVFVLLNLLLRTPALHQTAQNITLPANLPASTSLKQTNVAPEQDLNHYKSVEEQDFIIITGTFCTKINADKMKSKIVRLGLNPYEENLRQGCKRLGIKVIAGVKRDSMLMTVRSQIEPTAWILDQ